MLIYKARIGINVFSVWRSFYSKALCIERARRGFAQSLVRSRRRGSSSFVPNRHANKAPICVAIITSPRQVSYLLQSAASVLRGLDADSTLFIYTSQAWRSMRPNPVKTDVIQLKGIGRFTVLARRLSLTERHQG